MNRALLRIFIFLPFSLSLTTSIDVSAQMNLQDTLKIQHDTVFVKETINDKGIVEESELEIDGLMIDDTRTKAGHDFYDLLFSLWEAPPDARNYMIKIIEKPYRVNVTRVEIWVNEEILVNTILQPRPDLITELAQGVNKSLRDYLINISEVLRQLETEDQQGTGIY